MMYVLKTNDGKIVRVNPKTDTCLYSAPTNPPNTGLRYTRGSDLYMHIAQSKKRYFYILEWSMWQGEEENVYLVSEAEAKNFLIEKAGLSGWAQLSDSEMKQAEEVFPGIFDETA